MANGASPEPDDPRIGRTLGRYQIERRIGRGGMGVVYQARQLSLNRPVAIKVLPSQMAADDEFRERFRREAHAVAALSHENIVHVYDIEEADGAYFLVMELVAGQTLRQLRERRAFPAGEIRAIGIALTRALGCAHRQGIVHRDVKSQNVMVTPEGTVKLMDFGIAWVADGGVKTATGHVLGTPEFMSPEQAQTGMATAQSDLYSLGVLLFELATGRLPFTGTQPFQIAYKHIHEPVPSPRSLDPTVPEWLERVILRALEKDPARRYASAADMERDLAEAPASGAETLPASLAAPPPTTTAPTVLTPLGVTRGTYATLRLPGKTGPWLAAAAVVVAAAVAAWLLLPGGEPPAPASSPETRLATAPAPLAVEPPVPRDAEREAPRPREGSPTPRRPAPSERPVEAAEPSLAQPLVAEPPAPVPELPVSATFRCRRDVDFDVSPEEAVVVIDGTPIGPADDWDGSGGGRTWHPNVPIARACFRLKGHQGICVRLVLDPAAEEETCEVDTELEEIEEGGER